ELLRKTALGVGISRRFFIILEFQKTIGNDGTDFDMVCADLNSVAARVKSYMEQAGNIFLPACETDDGLHAAFYQILCRHKSETVPFSEHIEEILNGYMRESPDELPSINATEFFAPAWIDFTHHKHVVVDDKFYTFAYIPSYGYSQRVYAGWMSLFINASEGVDVDIFLTKIPKENIYNKIGMQVKLKRASASESHDTDSDYHQRLDTISSGEYMMLGLSGGEDFYYLSTLLTVVADSLDELEYKYRELEKRVKGQGMIIRRATFMMEECFASMVPVCMLHKDVERKARRNVLTSGASSCYPFISYEMQDPEGIMVGTNKHNNSLVSIDMFDTTAHPNANAVIIGATGSGKTFTAQLFALRLSLMNVQTFVIAPLKGREDYMGGCNAVGGQFVSMDPSAYN
ncbi:PrgI family protein, partial [Escherichia coli]|nr:PrgI family protein [Escherichia coli]